MTSDAVVIHAAPETSTDLFHVIPAGIVDPFTYIETGGRRAATVSVLDADKVAPLGIEILDVYALGRDDLQNQGLTTDQVENELALRACRELGVERALVPPTFPLAVADHLRAGGIELVPDAQHFVDRRRRKTGAQLEGIRRAQQAADAAMDVAARMIHAGGTTAEAVREAMKDVCESARLRAPRRRDRGARRPGGGRPRARPRPARRRRAGRRRHLAARQGLALLGGHDAHVRRRRRRAR